MEGTQRPKALQKLRDCLSSETDPGKLYKTLKKLSSLPVLSDRLSEIGFRQTIRSLRKQELLVPFAKDMVAWLSESLWLETQREHEQRDFDLMMLLKTERPGIAPQEKPDAPVASRDAQENCSGDVLEDLPWKPLSQRKRKRESTWKDEAQSPGGKAHLGESPSSKVLGPIAAVSTSLENQSSCQACFPVDGWEHSTSHTHPQGPPWERRRNFRTPVYSGPRPAPLIQRSHQGVLAEVPSGTWNAPCQATEEKKAETGQPAEESRHGAHPGKQPHSQTETQSHMQLQESQELRLQALIARIQSKQASKPQGRCTKMISFFSQDKSPGQREESRPRGAASSQSHSFPVAPLRVLAQRPPSLPSGLGCRNKTMAKRPAPLMAKSLRDYKNRYLRR